MAIVPNNQLINVKTWQEAELAWMLLKFVAINIANKKYIDFQNKTANLGDTVSFELAPQADITYGLTVNAFSIAQQRLQNLICCQSALGSVALSTVNFLFNAKDYMDTFGKSRIFALGSVVERDLLKTINGTQTVLTPQRPDFGQFVDTASGAYRFFGDGRTAINSQTQLSQAVANFNDYGAANFDHCAILPLTRIPAIIDTMSTKFAPLRNDDIVYDWQLGTFAGFDWYTSNLLPKHIAGSVGQANTTLTLTNVNDPSGNYVTQLTFSGATANDPKAITVGDLFSFNDSVSGQPNMRYLHFNGIGVSEQPVQCRVTGGLNQDTQGNIPADGSGNVTINIYPALKWTAGLGQTLQNLNNALAAGMQVSFANSYVAGILMSGNPLYMAMPQLPDMDPYKTSAVTDPESGVSIRHYWGSGLGNDVRGYIWDVLWAGTFVGENGMLVLFPYS